MENIEAIILDYGGTVDSPGIHWSRIIRDAYAREGFTTSEADFHRAYVFAERALALPDAVEPGDTFLQLMLKKTMLHRVVLPAIPEETARRVAERCHESARGHIEATRGVLEELSRRQPLVLLSNFYGNLRTVVREMGIEGCFGEILDSAVIGWRKPAPEAFQIAMSAVYAAPSRILMVGDSIRNDILPAHSLGLRTACLATAQTPLDALPPETLRIPSLASLLS